jgi:hypothetical protein
MVRPLYLKPQKKNPHGFVIKQHVFPSVSIARFVNADGRVSLFDKLRNKRRFAKPDDIIFCARRAWDHRAETGYMKEIENNFQSLVSRIIDGGVSQIDQFDKAIIDRFYALWHIRSRQRSLPAIEIQAKGLLGTKFTREQEENLEKNRYSFAREDGKFLAHQLNGVQIQVKVGKYAHSVLATAKWGIIQAHDGEFIVPDIPNHHIIPITPTVCLFNPTSNGIITKQNVAEINRSVRAESKRYYFARDLSLCHF